MPAYVVIADEVASEISSGRLRVGDRLPPQRSFARRHSIASSTASRVYAELARRGLVVGEVGRGTFVREGRPAAEPALTEPRHVGIDLELNFPTVPDQAELLSRSLGSLIDPDTLRSSLSPVGAAGTPAAREATSTLLARKAWTPSAQSIVFAGSGRQMIAAALAALVPTGGRLGVESLTYPVVKGIASRLGIDLVPIAVDDGGLNPADLRAVHRDTPLSALYIQPALHNPLGVTLSEDRRATIAETVQEAGLPVVEDAIYSFLHDELPFAALAPGLTVLVDSLSKRIAPGLTLGFAAAPTDLADQIARAVRSVGWAAHRFALNAATQWITDGTVAQIAEAKRADAQARQSLMRKFLAGQVVRADPRAYHCWWELPEPWRAETLVAAAARRGIALTPAAAFTVGSGRAPNAVRLALASPPPEMLATALDTLATLARANPEDSAATE